MSRRRDDYDLGYGAFLSAGLAALAAAFLANFPLELVPMPYYNAVPVIFGIAMVAGASRWFLGPRRKRMTG